MYISDQIYNSSVCGLRKNLLQSPKMKKSFTAGTAWARQACSDWDRSNWQGCNFELFVKKLASKRNYMLWKCRQPWQKCSKNKVKNNTKEQHSQNGISKSVGTTMIIPDVLFCIKYKPQHFELVLIFLFM